MGDGKPTRGGDISSDAHDSTKHVSDCRIVVVEVVRSSDGRKRIGGQVWGGSGTREGADGDIPGRHVVFVTSIDRDVVSLGSLQNETHDLINEAVRVLAPRHRGVQKIVEPTCYGVSNQTPESWEAETALFKRPGGAGTSYPPR